MAEEVFRTNFRQEGLESGKVTKTIRSNKKQIITTTIESKLFTEGQIGELRFVNEAEFNNFKALGTFSEYQGKVPQTAPVEENIVVTGKKDSIVQSPKIQLPAQESTTKDMMCSKCGMKMILASDTSSSGPARQLFFCPKCSNEQDMATPQVQPVKVEAEQPKIRRRLVPQIKKSGDAK